MFSLSAKDYRSKILGCGDGPASFNAEMNDAGTPIVSVDPIYVFFASQIEQRFVESIDGVISQVKQNSQNYVWSYHRDCDDLLKNRRAVMSKFVADFVAEKNGRYIAAALPHLPFANGAFDLALCSHLLFLYSDLLPFEFHLASIEEMLRVAKEVRIFPLLSLDCKPSRHVAPVITELKDRGYISQVETVGYGLQRNGDRMMRVRKI
jgi:hypothetical protein